MSEEDVIILSKEKIREGLLRDLREVSPSALAVFLVIHAFSDDDKNSSISMQKIGELTGLTFPAVQSTIKRMINDGVIKAKKRGNKAFYYTIY